MHWIFLVVGIIITAFGVMKYVAIRRNEPRRIKVAGMSISEELIWIVLFVIGFTIIIGVAIQTLEPHFKNTRDF